MVEGVESKEKTTERSAEAGNREFKISSFPISVDDKKIDDYLAKQRNEGGEYWEVDQDRSLIIDDPKSSIIFTYKGISFVFNHNGGKDLEIPLAKGDKALIDKDGVVKEIQLSKDVPLFKLRGHDIYLSDIVAMKENECSLNEARSINGRNLIKGVSAVSVNNIKGDLLSLVGLAGGILAVNSVQFAPDVFKEKAREGAIASLIQKTTGKDGGKVARKADAVQNLLNTAPEHIQNGEWGKVATDVASVGIGEAVDNVRDKVFGRLLQIPTNVGTAIFNSYPVTRTVEFTQIALGNVNRFFQWTGVTETKLGKMAIGEGNPIGQFLNQQGELGRASVAARRESGNIFVRSWNGIKGAGGSVVDVAKSAGTAVVNFAKNPVGSIANGIKRATTATKSSVVSGASSVLQWVTKPAAAFQAAKVAASTAPLWSKAIPVVGNVISNVADTAIEVSEYDGKELRQKKINSGITSTALEIGIAAAVIATGPVGWAAYGIYSVVNAAVSLTTGDSITKHITDWAWGADEPTKNKASTEKNSTNITRTKVESKHDKTVEKQKPQTNVSDSAVDDRGEKTQEGKPKKRTRARANVSAGVDENSGEKYIKKTREAEQTVITNDATQKKYSNANVNVKKDAKATTGEKASGTDSDNVLPKINYLRQSSIEWSEKDTKTHPQIFAEASKGISGNGKLSTKDSWKNFQAIVSCNSSDTMLNDGIAGLETAKCARKNGYLDQMMDMMGGNTNEAIAAIESNDQSYFRQLREGMSLKEKEDEVLEALEIFIAQNSRSINAGQVMQKSSVMIG